LELLLHGCLQAGWYYFSIFGLAALFSARGWEDVRAICAGLASICAVAMASFWIGWALPAANPSVNIGITAMKTALLASFAAIAVRAVCLGYWRRSYAVPLLLAFAGSIILLIWAFGLSGGTDPLQVAASRWTHDLPPDNRIPLLFARGVLQGAIPSPLLGDWLSSDRPPLQSALYLISPGLTLRLPSEITYQALGTAVQMTVLLGAWILARSLKASRSVSLVLIVTVFFMPLVLVNGIFVWPKLLAAGLLCAAASLFLQRPRSWQDNLLVGALSGFSFLSHGTTAYVLLAIAGASLLLRINLRVVPVASMALGFLLVCGPWVAYQRYIDPPGDRLLKYHLAGVEAVDGNSVSSALRDQYATLSWDEIVRRRQSDVAMITDHALDNIALTLEAARDLLAGDKPAARERLKTLRIDQFFRFVAGSGLIGLAFFLLPAGLLMRQLRPLSFIVALALVIWIATSFSANATTIHQGSMFPEVAIVVAAVAATANFSTTTAMVLMAVHSATTVFQYSF
jgi:hypothetical protein